MVKDHSDSERDETRCHHIGYSFRLAARVLLLTGTRNSYISLPKILLNTVLEILVFKHTD